MTRFLSGHPDVPCRTNARINVFTEGKHSRAQAKERCAGCPVIADCREYAIGHPEVVGIWGGTTTRERADIRRQRAAGEPVPVPDAPLSTPPAVAHNTPQEAVSGHRRAERPPCGTESRYRSHTRRRELVDAACQQAHTEAVEADRRAALATIHATVGGNLSGYDLHRRLGEEACPPCRAAMSAKSAARRAAQHAAAAEARRAADRERHYRVELATAHAHQQPRGANIHRALGEPSCDACKTAVRQQTRDRVARRRSAHSAALAQLAADARAQADRSPEGAAA